MPLDYNAAVTGFTKLFSSIIHSTIWREDMPTKVVWITMLAMADRNGRVLASLPGLADAARVSICQAESSLVILCNPDKHSRTRANEGRRVREIEGGWQILNYLKFRNMRDETERRIQTREAVRRYRERVKSNRLTVSHGKPRQAQAEAEAEAETDLSSKRARAASVWYDTSDARIADEREVLRLARHIADIHQAVGLEPADPVEIMRIASDYKGSERSKINPAAMTDDRLKNTLLDLRAGLREAKQAQERQAVKQRLAERGT